MALLRDDAVGDGERDRKKIIMAFVSRVPVGRSRYCWVMGVGPGFRGLQGLCVGGW